MKTMKKSVSILLAALMLATTFVVCLMPQAAAEVGTSYQKGDVIEYGSYPQTKVTNQSICTALESILYEPNTDAVAKSYNYEYNGGSKLNMLYVDLYYQGVKYRGVKIGQYRPTSRDHDAKADNSYQDNNGYELNKWYFFKYEPLQWTVLDPDEGIVFCNRVIDSQIFHDNKNGYYPYENSTLKTWLNNDFYKTMVGDNYRLSEIEDCTLLSRVDVLNYLEDITWDCDASDYAFSQNYCGVGNKDGGWWTKEVRYGYPRMDTSGSVYYGWLSAYHFSGVTACYPFYFYTSAFLNAQAIASLKEAIKIADESGWFYDEKSGQYFDIDDILFDNRCLIDVTGNAVAFVDYPYDGLLTPAFYYKKAYSWEACVHKNVPVGDYHVCKGIRPVLKLKKLENNNYDNGYLLSSGANASTVVVETVGKGGVSGTGLKPEPVTGRQYTYLMNGQSVTLTATPNSGYAFDGWYKYGSDGYTKVSSNAAYTVTAQDHGYYKAQFKQTTQVKMFVKGFSTGSGYMTCNKQSMAVGESALFNAYPDHDSYFTGWYGGLDQGNGWYGNFQKLSDSPQYANLTLEFSNEAFFAEFQRATLIEKIDIKAGINPTTGGGQPTKESFRLINGTQNDFTINSVRWDRINSNGTTTQMASNETFVRGGNYQLTVFLKKTSDASHKLIPDEVKVLVNGDPNCTKPAEAGPSVYAITYRYMNLQDYNYKVYVITEDLSDQWLTGKEIPGGVRNFSAPTLEGKYFVGWFYKQEDGTMPTENDTCYSTDADVAFRMPGYDTRLAAIFKQIPPDCVVGAKPLSNFGGLVTGGGTYAPGTSITVTATPDEGYAFEGWYHEGNLFSTENPCELDVPGTESITLEAKFGKLIRLKKPTDQLNDGDWYFDADATYAALAQKMGVSVEELIAFTDSVFYNAIAEYDPDSGLLILRDANSSDPNDCSEFRPGDDAYEAYTAGVKQYKAPTQPDNPGQPDNPQPQPDPNMCHWCGKVHEGFFQKIIGFFHNIFAKIFGNKY